MENFSKERTENITFFTIIKLLYCVFFYLVIYSEVLYWKTLKFHCVKKIYLNDHSDDLLVEQNNF